jgi:glycine dehydrogenase subunit 1
MPATVHPAYRKTVTAIVRNQGIELVELPFDEAGGHTDPAVVDTYAGEDIAALVIPQPNFFGILEEVDRLSDWAAANGALSIAVANPVALALLKPPGQWGASGVDICCGEGQPLGVPLASGGPYFGFLCARREYARQMPGRIVGRTLDIEGKTGFTLTLQAREQHIRRSKATSNICTNQGLMVTAATIHMAMLGAEGLRRVAAASHRNTAALVEGLASIDGVEPVFSRPFFHESVLRLPIRASDALRSLAAHNVLGGLDLEVDYPELGNTILVCATEKRTTRDIDLFQEKLARVIATRSQPGCPVKPKFD